MTEEGLPNDANATRSWRRDPFSGDERTRNNAICIAIGVVLLITGATIRYYSGGKFDIKVTDILLLTIPTLLWLLASGQLESLKLGSGGFQVKSAIQSASAKPASLEIKGIDVTKVSTAQKEDIMKLYAIIALHPRALSFVLRKDDDYYEDYALEQYIYELSKLPDFRYFLFFGHTATQQFLGGIASTQFCQSLLSLNSERDSTTEGRLPICDLAKILNGKADFARIKAMPGFVGIDKALRKGDDTRTALAYMDEIGINWLPVRERYNLLGIVEQSALTASLVLDVVNALSGSARGRAS